MKVNQYAFRIEKSLMEELRAIGNQQDRSMNYMAKKAIQFYVDSQKQKKGKDNA